MEKILTIENDWLRVNVAVNGAELRSIWDKQTGREQLWQADPAVWKDSAPWLFPVVGRLKDDCCRWKGQSCAIPMHGFASGMPFELNEISGQRLALVLKDTRETRVMYPAAFELHIIYELDGAALRIQVCVANPADEELLFSIGAHPGFVSSQGDVLHFDKPYDVLLQRLDLAQHLLKPDVQRMTTDSIILQEELFDEDAMILTDPAMTGVVLQRQDGSGIRMDFGRVPWLGIWSRKRAGLRYVCIEPWFGADDPLDASGVLDEKPGIQRLAPGTRFEWNLSICSLSPKG